MKNILRLVRYAKPYKGYVFISILAMLVQVFVAFYIPRLMVDVVDIALPAQDFNQVMRISLLMLALALLGAVGGVVNTYTSQYISQYASAELRLDLFNKIQTLSFKNVDDFKASRLITNATNDVMRVQMFFTMMLRIIIRAPIMVVMGLVLALQTSLLLSQVFLITLPLLIISIVVIIILAYPRFKKVQVALDNVNNVVLENANAPQVVKSFVSQDNERAKFEKTNEFYRKVNTSAEKIMAFADPMINLIFNLGVALILVIAAYYLNEGMLFNPDTGTPQVGLIIMFNAYSQQILIGLMMFAMMMIFISRADVSATRINEIFDVTIDLVNEEGAQAHEMSGEITFKDVSFGYGENGNYVLKDLNFSVSAGEKIGIIGSTGSGKSSLMMLIPRLYDVKSGDIFFDGNAIKSIDIKHLRDQIGYVTQHATLFSGSLATNIMQGAPKAERALLDQVSEEALLKDYIAETEEGYNHLVKSKGTNLSGGQKQRVSIARALIKRPKILVLDDSTSAVDLQSERKILNYIDSVDYKPTLLLISQKIATVRRMDKILVLNNEGMIDGFATHDVLMNESKVYQEIASSQLNIGGGDSE